MIAEGQTSSSVLLVRPAAFGFNAEGAETNAFARPAPDPEIRSAVLREFDGLARRLDDAGIEVLVLDDTPDPAKPDAVFPNNWVSFHADGTMVLYPMASASRRLERDPARLGALLAAKGFDVRRTIDLTGHEREGRFLESTGSLILDRPLRRAYASISPRTDPSLIAEFDGRLGYSTVVFKACDRHGRPIYHTNVLMSLGTRFGALCTEVVAQADRQPLLDSIERSGRTIVELDYEQLRSFACNIIELRRRSGEPLIAMSAQAKRSLRPDQAAALQKLGGELVEADIATIEAVGGGSVRCMIADIHLPRI